MKTARIIFVSMFCLLLLLPVLLFDFNSEVSTKENRKLAALPPLIGPAGVNWNVFSQLDSFIKDRYGLRSMLVSLNSNIKYRLLKAYGNDKALLGKDGWLFYADISDGDNLADFLKKNILKQSEIVNWTEKIRSRADWCNRNGIAFLLVIAPNKHSVYSEKYPLERPGGLTRSDQLAVYLQEHTRVNMIFPRNLIISQKNGLALYSETGTHWNNKGAFIAFDAIKQYVKRLLPLYSFTDYEYGTSVSHLAGGDIPPMLGLDSYGKYTQISYKPRNADWTDIYVYKKDRGRNGVVTVSKDKKLPKAMIFRDSFFDPLIPFVSTMFSRADYRWKILETSDKKAVLKDKPDIIILEIAERMVMGVLYSDWR